MSEKPDPVKTRRTLILLAAVSLLPFVGAVLLYVFWTPQSATNYGELIDPVPLAPVALAQTDGQVFRFASLRGQWAFLMTDAGKCDEHCRAKLYLMRQIRLTLGKDQDRLVRVWIIDDGVTPDPGALAEFSGTRAVLLSQGNFAGQLPARSSPRDHVFLVDPFGNLMMRFPRNADLSKVKKDMSKLMKISSGWVQVPSAHKAAP